MVFDEEWGYGGVLVFDLRRALRGIFVVFDEEWGCDGVLVMALW